MTIAELIAKLEKFGLETEIEVPHTSYNGCEDITWLDEPVIIATEEGNIVLCTEMDIPVIKNLRGGLTEAELEAQPKKSFSQICKEIKLT